MIDFELLLWIYGLRRLSSFSTRGSRITGEGGARDDTGSDGALSTASEDVMLVGFIDAIVVLLLLLSLSVTPRMSSDFPLIRPFGRADAFDAMMTGDSSPKSPIAWIEERLEPERA